MKLNLALAATTALAITNNVAATNANAAEELAEVEEMVVEEVVEEQEMLAKLETLDLTHTRFDVPEERDGDDGDVVIDFDAPDLAEPVADDDGVAEAVPVLISAEPDTSEEIIATPATTTLKEGKAKKPPKSHQKKTKSPSAYSKSSSLDAPPVHTKAGKSKPDHKGKSSKRAKSHSMPYDSLEPPAKHHPRPDSKAHKGTVTSNSTTSETMAAEPAVEEPDESPVMIPEPSEPIDENNATEPVPRTGADTSDLKSDNQMYKQEVAELIMSGLGVSGNLEETGQSINIGKGHQQNQNVEALDLLREKADAKKAALANGSVGRSSLFVGGVCLLGSIVYGLMV